MTSRYCVHKFLALYVTTILFFSNEVIISVAERIFPGNPYSHREIFDPEGKFLLEWIADPKNTDVVFNITAATRGWVGIGFSKTGKMTKSDIVIGGVSDSGIAYLRDWYTGDRRLPIRDLQQNWRLIDAWENRTHTSMTIVRDKETCDPHDLPMNENTIHLMWAYGEDDLVDYHVHNRGSVKAHIFQPDLTPQINPPSLPPTRAPQQQQQRGRYSKPQRTKAGSTLARFSSVSAGKLENVDVWRLTVTANSTKTGDSWCVFQEGPELRKLHYISAFSTPMDSDKVEMNLDRVVVYKCSPIREGSNNDSNNSRTRTRENLEEEAGQNDAFQQWFDYSGECKNATELFSYCKRIIYTWGNGGKEIFLPRNTGIPFGGPEEYYLVEAFVVPPPQNSTNRHKRAEPAGRELTNTTAAPTTEQEEFTIDIDIDLLLTETPRKFEAKIFRIGYNTAAPLIIPPAAPDFEVFGHCPSECTTRLIPRTKPLRVFGVSFDTGPLGKAVGLHHLRNAFEIPLIAQDYNHDPSFQQLQILREPKLIRPGDQLSVRCKLKSATPSPDALNNAAPRSLSFPPPAPLNYTPRCIAYLWYYEDMGNVSRSNASKHSNLHECMSKIHPSDIARWIDENAPIELKRHINLPQVLMNKLKRIKWTPHLRLSLSELYELGRYRSACGGGGTTTPAPAAQQRGHRKQFTTNNYYNGTRRGFRQNINRGHNNNNNGTIGRSRGPTPTLAPISPAGELTVYPLPVEEELPYTIGCPTLDDEGLLFGVPPRPRAPVIFGR